MKAKILKMRLPKKVMFILAGVLLLGGASGAFALYAAKDGSHAEAAEEASLSGQACTTVQTLKLRRNGKRWIRKYVNTESIDGIERVRTALRVTGVLATQEKADFYQVVVLDHAGPKDRAHMRGAAIGAEVLFAPQPDQIPGMSAPFVAKYNDADANMAGLFHGTEVVMPLDKIKATMTAMDDKSDCMDVVVELGEPGSDTEHKSMPGDEEVVAGHEPAGKHGEAEDAGHGEAATEGDGHEKSGHGDATAEETHGDAAAEPEAGGGMFASIKGMIFGAEEAPAEHEPEGHEAASSPAHDAAPVETGEHSTVESHDAQVVDHAAEPHEAVVPDTSHDEAVPEKPEEHAEAEKASAH